MAGFENDVLIAKNVNFNTLATAPRNGIITADGQVLIGAITTTPTNAIKAGFLNSLNAGLTIAYNVGTGNIDFDLAGAGSGITSINVDANTPPGTDPVLPTGGGQVTITGAQVATGVIGANVIRTDSLAANTFTIEIQRTTDAVAANSTLNGVSHFDSAAFDVDANGFVQLLGGAIPLLKIGVETSTPPGTNPVVANGAGIVNFDTILVNAATIDVINFDSSAVNTVTLQIQKTSALAAPDATKNGVAHFDSSDFSVDADGFVTLSATGFGETITGNSGGALSPTAGNWNIYGASVAAGTTPVATSGAVSTLTVNVQRSQAIAAADATKVGLSNFDSAAFDVDVNGFVQLNGGGIAATSFNVDTNTAPGTDPVVPTAAGQITITGGQIATGILGANVIRTNSLAANTYTIEIQRTDAVAASDSTKNGVSHFNSSQFSVDTDGFVELLTPPSFAPNSTIQLFDDFLIYSTFQSTGPVPIISSGLNWRTSATVPMLGMQAGQTLSTNPGVIRSSNLAAGGPNSFIIMANGTSGLFPAFILGGGQLTVNWVLKTATLSDGTNRYILRFGIGDTTTGDQANGCYFEYSDDINGGNYVIKTAAGSVRTSTNTATAATTGYMNFKIVVNAASSSVEFFIDNVSQGSIITNIPTLAVAPVCVLDRTAGTLVLGSLQIDLFYLTQSLTAAR